MKLKFANPPAGSVAELHAAVGLASSNSDVQMGMKLGGAAAVPADHFPHEIFFVGLKDIEAGKGFESLKSTGWRYLIDQDGHANSVEVHCDGGGEKHRFSEINMGPFPNATKACLKTLESKPEFKDGEYTLSAIRIPALYVFALWFKDLKSGHQLIIPIAPTNRVLQAGKPYAPTDFFATLQPLAKVQLAFDK